MKWLILLQMHICHEHKRNQMYPTWKRGNSQDVRNRSYRPANLHCNSSCHIFLFIGRSLQSYVSLKLILLKSKKLCHYVEYVEKKIIWLRLIFQKKIVSWFCNYFTPINSFANLESSDLLFPIEIINRFRSLRKLLRITIGDFESKEQLICNPKQSIRQNTYIKQLFGLNFNFTTLPASKNYQN